MKEQTSLKIDVKTPAQYLNIWAGIFQLTDSERQVLSYMMDDPDPFSTEGRKRLTALLNYTSANTINVYIKNLKGKYAILESENGYRINPVLLPCKKLVIDLEWKST